MKYLKSTLILTALLAFLTSSMNAQYVTSYAKISMPGQQKGIYYALPRTVIQLDLMVDKIELVEGPFSDYAYMVGASDIITDDDIEYALRDVVMHTYAEADPNAMFFVAINAKKGESQPFYLNSKGILEGVGMVGEHHMMPPAPPIKKQEPLGNKSFKYQFGANGIRGEEQQARAAAEMISRLREEKIKLLTGFQETAFTLDTYRQMYADIDEMETEYLSLFIGKRVITPTVQTVYVTLSKEAPSKTIGSFSKRKGFIANGGEEIDITVKAVSLKNTANINALSPSAIETIGHENKLFYRIPETVNLKVALDDEILIEQRVTLAQFGVFMLAPLGHTKILFDPETGQIISMGME